ncbi:sulfur oxidation c-type cytochrome SoxA [Ponticaulis sp.]|uniref:sulfur oxidation c-type cytochrome SoxA n=1 Tax=Ponticaulis sp. TaxID=2020902 RepID=UPI000B6B42F9|nr:sulfur oxidation c-type cytochrome SoxA [Ponticaulis sp.]MAI89522.1 sulfur oxidation c-type cytochrome SoxA [Ponticaulis sp.]OUY00555.1 MAG: sulfur oxidation c-type cytochrome SoxA [Hyphomonadaceae bacterium TMED5]|tara:strand:+ start:179986 stop:180771 length:786 start_codon:yes stop_codon:yes gene_type:complete
MRLLFLFLSGFTLSACSAAEQPAPRNPGLDREEIVSGSAFLTPESRSLQADSFSNPGYLWVDRGSALFSQTPEGGTQSCSSCHEDGMSGIAATYPAFDEQNQTLVNLEGRINLCRTRYQNSTPLEYESDDLLALAAFIAEQSQGVPINVELTANTQPAYDRGEAYFFTRRGQLNLSCHNCHDENWGKQLRGDTISQGHGNGFPGYRLEWESFGSLHRRLADCDAGVRAEPFPLGSQTYVELEFYLANRSRGLPIESPGIRR